MRLRPVCCGCAPFLEGFEKLSARDLREHLEKAKKPHRAHVTAVGRYVSKEAGDVALALRKVLTRYGKEFATKASKAYADEFEKLQKDTGTAARIQAIIDELNSEDLGRDLNGELEGPVLAAFKTAAARGAQQVGIEIADITAQVDDAAVAYAEEHGGELIKDLAGTTDESMRSLLSRAVEDGMSADELSDEIEGLGAFSDYRADTIARTELATAHVQGNVDGWRESGVVDKKKWILGDSHDIADECDEAADAGEVDLDDDFVDGIDFPPAHPNCICDVEPVLSEEDDDSEKVDRASLAPLSKEWTQSASPTSGITAYGARTVRLRGRIKKLASLIPLLTK
jgi:hypothetical protein